MRLAETAYKDGKVCATGSTFNTLRSLGVWAVRVRGLLEQKLKTILFVESAGEDFLCVGLRGTRVYFGLLCFWPGDLTSHVMSQQAEHGPLQ